MAKIFVNSKYEIDKEVKLGEVKPGHTILITNGNGEAQPYIVCKIGNTPIDIKDDKKTVLICNPVTGRVVIKHPAQKCVVVSGFLEITPYAPYKTDGNNDYE